MKYTELYKLNNDGSQKVITTCYLSEDGLVFCEGNEILIENLKEKGIKNYEDPDGQQLFFSDGVKFLEQLKFNFTSGYLNASEVKEKDGE